VLTLEDVRDLDASQQYERGVYYNITGDGDDTISIYAGSATGAQGFVQRHLVHHHWTSSSLPLSANPVLSLNKLESTIITYDSTD
jgi:hypothetical protein